MAEARLRLFFAVTPPPEVLTLLDRAGESLRARFAQARFTAAEARHVTLRFLGWVDAGDAGRLEQVTSEVALRTAPGHGTVTRLGAFPQPRRARVLWAGVQDEDGTIARLGEGLQEELGPLGWEREDRPFVPHVTLARFREPADVRSVAGVEIEGAPRFPVDRLDLYSSRLHPSGARYRMVASEYLRGGDAG